MFCAACGDPIPLGGGFCPACGVAACSDSVATALQAAETCRFCPACGLVMDETGRFCPHCSACAQCGTQRTPATPDATSLSNTRAMPGSNGTLGERVAAVALDVLLIPYVFMYAMPFMPSTQVWLWTMLSVWCGNIVAGNVTGRSLGKRLLHIRVVHAGSSEAPGLVRGLVRTTVYVATGGPIGLGALWALADNHGRGLHDLLAGTIVLRHEASVGSRSPMRPDRGRP